MPDRIVSVSVTSSDRKSGFPGFKVTVYFQVEYNQNQGRIQKYDLGGARSDGVSSPLLPLEVGPLKAARGLGSAVSSPSGVWGGTPAEIEFGTS